MNMTTLVDIQDVDEFARVTTIPDDAISDLILSNMRNLGEAEMEASLREILYDPNETPHGPTEIADILTSLHINSTFAHFRNEKTDWIAGS